MSMSKFVGVEPLGSLNVECNESPRCMQCQETLHSQNTGVNACLCVARRQALLLILGQPVNY